MRIGGGNCGSRGVVRVEAGRGKNEQVILVGTKLFRLPRLCEGLGVELGVAEHLVELVS